MSDSTLTVLHQRVRATPERVFAELADGWTYVGWVVGATHIRDVDDNWPAVGSKIHHKVGGWPVAVADATEVLECEPTRRLVLRAKGWPLGEAIVEIVLTELDPGITDISLGERPDAGPAGVLDNPLLRWLLRLRNAETLRRLRDRVENRPGPG